MWFVGVSLWKGGGHSCSKNHRSIACGTLSLISVCIIWGFLRVLSLRSERESAVTIPFRELRVKNTANDNS